MFGRSVPDLIDILVNNAGVGQATMRSDNRQHPIEFREVTPEQWKLFVAVHTNAPMALSRALVHDMMRQKWGRIVNVTTSLGTMIREGAPTYGPSKAALEAFSATMAKDLAGTGVGDRGPCTAVSGRWSPMCRSASSSSLFFGARTSRGCSRRIPSSSGTSKKIEAPAIASTSRAVITGYYAWQMTGSPGSPVEPQP
jgi:NAD(P)-dependent dehydrogenase (short-subunit alcohol dehydrogenase family)